MVEIILRRKSIFLIFTIALLPIVCCKRESIHSTKKVEDARIDTPTSEEQTTGDVINETQYTGQKCMAENLKIEAQRRLEETQTEPLFLKAGLHSLSVSLLNSVSQAVSSKKFDDLPGIVQKIWNDMKKFRPSTSSDDMELLKNIVTQRASAYASCMSVATRDISWCESIEKLSKNHSNNCSVLYALFVVIAQEAILNGKICEEVSNNFNRIPSNILVETCNAIKEEKPDRCPWKETENAGLVCRAVASRGISNHCSKLNDEKTIKCCELLAWRFMNIISGHAEPYIIPEAGALQKDDKGCMRSLHWGIMKDTAGLFELETDEEKVKESYKNMYGEYLCPMIVYWSGKEPPF